MVKTLFISLAILAMLPVQAFARNYSVEAIIFSHSVSADTAIVEWDAKSPRNIRSQTRLDTRFRQAKAAAEDRQSNALNTPSTTEPQADTGAPAEIRTEVVNQLDLLLEIQAALLQNPEYEILQTLSWQQAEANYQDSPLINTATPHMMGVLRVYAPNLLFVEFNLLYAPGEILEASLVDNQTDPAPLAEVSPASSGSFASYSFDSEGNLLPQAQAIVERYFLEEKRKLKLKEIHYFDHPRFGVILTVTPLESTPTAASQ